MKCETHPYEVGVGVCASCLRERLLALIAAQNELPAAHHHHYRRRSSDPPPPPPPPLLFLRSVSPYVSHRRSVGSDASPAHPHHQVFFSTPQVGPTFGAAARGCGRRRRFSTFKALFGRHRLEEEAEPGVGAPKASASGSWLSALIRGRRKKKKTKMSHSEERPPPPTTTTVRAPRVRQAVERGMSPSMEDEGEDDGGGYCSDSWRRQTTTPIRRFTANNRHHSSVGAGSGFSVCLSPLVRFGLDARRSQAAEAGISVDRRSSANSIHRRNQQVGDSEHGPSRTRKLTEFGRFK